VLVSTFVLFDRIVSQFLGRSAQDVLDAMNQVKIITIYHKLFHICSRLNIYIVISNESDCSSTNQKI